MRTRVTLSAITALLLLSFIIFSPPPVRGEPINPAREFVIGISMVILGALWLPYLFRKDRNYGIAAASIALVAVTACSPGTVNTPKIDFHILNTNEVGFLIDRVHQVESTREVGTNPLVDLYQRGYQGMKREFQINFSRVSIGNCVIGSAGCRTADLPDHRLYVVNTGTVSAYIQEEPEGSTTPNNSIRTQVLPSSGMQVPTTIQARILEVPTLLPMDTNDNGILGDEGDESVQCAGAATYLAEIGTLPAAGDVSRVDAIPLDVTIRSGMKDSIRDALMDQTSEHDMDYARLNQGTIVRNVFNEVRRLWCERYGVEVRTINMTDGYIFDDPALQDAYDRQVVEQQNVQNAQAWARQTQIAADTSANATQVAVQGIATQAAIIVQVTRTAGEAELALLQQRGEILSENPGLVELARVEQWDGRYPTNYGGGNGPVLLMQVTQEPRE